MAADGKGHVAFTQEAVRRYLDELIHDWQRKQDADERMELVAPYYIDAYQCVRTYLFGEKLPLLTPEQLTLPDDLRAVLDDLGKPLAESCGRCLLYGCLYCFPPGSSS